MQNQSEQAKRVLKDVFGYDEFRPLQREIIDAVLEKRDSLVVMPTGGGKSLCYQVPALIFEGLTVVVSPLISLMHDQVAQLRELGVAAVCLNSSLSTEEYRRTMGALARGEVKLLYAAPETLLLERTMALFERLEVDCLAIDEAHCISEWGHDFRPEYRQLARMREGFSSAVCIALTATATVRVRKDIQASLGFTSADEFIAGFDRPNLFLEALPKSDPVSQTLDFIRQFPDQAGIIYCATRREVNEVAAVLRTRGYSASAYHAGLSDDERRRNQEAFIGDNIQIMVATIAFGMGINKPDIRFVVHYNLPRNIESYYQQIGRAGRDGLNARCLLLFGYGDIRTIKYFINQKIEAEQRAANLHLGAMVGFAEAAVCRRIPLLAYFGETRSETDCGMCDNCTAEKQELEELTTAAQKFLSCVKRTGEIFGAGHVIDVLRGSKAKKLIQRGHERLSTYNIGGEYSKRQWFHLSRQFLQLGLLRQDQEHGGLSLTPEAWEVLRGERSVMGRVEEARRDEKQKTLSDSQYDSDLFELLRLLRKELADGANLPPYMIFPDTTLIAMSRECPQSRDRLLDMPGVGAVKLEKYAAVFLDAIRGYCRQKESRHRS